MDVRDLGEHELEMVYSSVELCAGAGGQARGLEMAGFEHVALVEIDSHACNTLRHNRPQWNDDTGYHHYSIDVSSFRACP